MTNSDRIRNMTDEQLAELLLKTIGDCSDGSECPAEEVCEGTTSCREVILKWLKDPVETLEEKQ